MCKIDWGIDFWQFLSSVQHYADGPRFHGRVPAVAAVRSTAAALGLITHEGEKGV
jgi:hypothetical protein